MDNMNRARRHPALYSGRSLTAIPCFPDRSTWFPVSIDVYLRGIASA